MHLLGICVIRYAVEILNKYIHTFKAKQIDSSGFGPELLDIADKG